MTVLNFGLFQAERFNAVGTNTGAVAEFGRYAREQSIGNFHARAPARAFAGGHGAKLTLIGLVAQRALTGIKTRLIMRQIHGLLALTR